MRELLLPDSLLWDSSNNRLPASRNKRSSRRRNLYKIIRQMICRSK